MLTKAEHEGAVTSKTIWALLSSKIALLKAARRTVLTVGWTLNYATNMFRARWLKAAGIKDLAHTFPNMELYKLFLFRKYRSGRGPGSYLQT